MGRVSWALGWLVIALSCVYAGWLLLAFVVAVPTPDYMLPRILVVGISLFVGTTFVKNGSKV